MTNYSFIIRASAFKPCQEFQELYNTNEPDQLWGKVWIVIWERVYNRVWDQIMDQVAEDLE